MPLPLTWKPDRGSADSYVRIREHARIVTEARAEEAGKFELLPVEVGFGLTRLPEPSDGDVFLDLEGAPCVGEHGLEYLFVTTDAGKRNSLAFLSAAELFLVVFTCAWAVPVLGYPGWRRGSHLRDIRYKAAGHRATFIS